MTITNDCMIEIGVMNTVVCKKSIENFVFRPKMAIFRRAGTREEGLSLPLAFNKKVSPKLLFLYEKKSDDF